MHANCLTSCTNMSAWVSVLYIGEKVENEKHKHTYVNAIATNEFIVELLLCIQIQYKSWLKLYFKPSFMNLDWTCAGIYSVQSWSKFHFCTESIQISGLWQFIHRIPFPITSLPNFLKISIWQIQVHALFWTLLIIGSGSIWPIHKYMVTRW